MSKGQQASRQVTTMLLVGIFLFGIAFFVPDAGQHNGSLLKMAWASSWKNLMDMPAVWGSMKIILFSIGLFSAVESVGTILALLKHQNLALAVFSLQLVSVLGFLTGLFCLVKAVL